MFDRPLLLPLTYGCRPSLIPVASVSRQTKAPYPDPDRGHTNPVAGASGPDRRSPAAGLTTPGDGHVRLVRVRLMLRRVAVVGVVAAAAAIGGDHRPSTSAQAPARDPWLRPFSPTSIWNMPIGSGAQYVDAGLPEPELARLDVVILRRLSADDPAQPLVEPGDWRNRCSGTEPTGVWLNIPDDLVIEDADDDNTPNNTAALLSPDGRTLVNTNALARCTPGGPIFGWQTGNPAIDRTDLYGDGRLGSHGASKLSAIGGAIRPGELSGEVPIQHALDLLVWGEHMHWDGDGYRWPAESADSYAAEEYRGDNPHVQMGSLLAIPPDVAADDLDITTDVGRRLFTALQDYGGYITDDAAWNAGYVSVDEAAIGTFPWGDPEQDDLERLFDALHVVTNSGPDSIGGGGEPRRPLLAEVRPGEAQPGEVRPTSDASAEPPRGAPRDAFVVVARRWLGVL